MSRVLAAADIGSNTVHLLVAATDGELVTRIDNLSEWIPLGEAVARSGFISNERIDQLVFSMKECKRLAIARKAEALYVFATEAMRMARNHAVVIQKIQSEAGVHVEIITPRKEIELSLAGTSLDSEFETELLFEVGGGSAQVAYMSEGRLDRHWSLPMGTGRVIAEAKLTNPCPHECFQEATRHVALTLQAVDLSLRKDPKATCSGGVGRGLWRALHPDGEKRIFRQEVEYLAWATARLPVDRVASRFGVKQRRAQTLLPGAIVYKALMERFGVSEMSVSEFGVREGAILKIFREEIEACAL